MTDNAWLIGVGLAVGGSIVSNLGVNLQKLYHVKHAAETESRGATPEATSPAASHYGSIGAASAPGGAMRGGRKHSLTPSLDGGGVKSRSLGDHHGRRRTLSESGEPHMMSHVAWSLEDEKHDMGPGVERDGPDQPLLKVDSDSVMYQSKASTQMAHSSTSVEGKSSGRDAYRRPYYLQPLWIMGLACVVVGAIADFSALGFTSQMIVAPLGGITLVSNIFFAPYFSGEQLTKTDIYATVTIICGSALSVAFGSHETQEYTFEELFDFYKEPRFFFYALFVWWVVSIVYKQIQVIEEAMDRAKYAPLEDMDPKKTLVDRLAELPWGRRLLLQMTRFGYASIAGTTGGQSVLFAKGLAIIVHEGDVNAFIKVPSYLLLGGMLTTICLQIKWLNNGLELFDALYVVPVFQAFWIGFGVISGMIVYRESQGLTWTQLCIFGIGLFITLTGVVSLSQRSTESFNRYAHLKDSRRNDFDDEHEAEEDAHSHSSIHEDKSLN